MVHSPADRYVVVLLRPAPAAVLLAALLTYLCDCALAPLHGTGYQSHEPSSECFAALIALLMPASISYPIVISAVIVAVLVKGGVRRRDYYPFHPAAVGMVVAGVSWPQDVFRTPFRRSCRCSAA